MTQPETGTTWIGAGLDERGNEFLERGKPVAVLVRDARGEATNISPHNSDGSVAWSPFAQDNTWRDDLLGRIKVDGYVVTNPEPNEGFLHCGAFKDGDGPASKPSISQDYFRILQSNFPYDSDLMEEAEMFSFTPVDTGNPTIRRLRRNLPLSDGNGNIIVEDPGLSDAGWSRVLSGSSPSRQILLVREYRRNNLPIYTVDGYAMCKLDDIGNSKKDKKDSEGAELTYNPLPDSFFMAMQDGEYQPVLMHTWVGGTGWTALGGVPVFASAAPVATATDALTGTLAFTEPTGTGDPWSYTAQQSTDAGATWSTAITPDSVGVAGGTVTLTLTLEAGASLLKATATGSNGATATTANSNSITVAGS